ncbi:SET domain-containing protein-lysine N-methyltransferase [Thalassotalea sp. G20_0]|uniref:SET domain-containing protein n=1 Tax=Thalassotalea sp. G20_0 TaxID=2821093 RepID=UPI001ADCF40D|nr:SET domain-containing protein-lysine N-methyltransferase [Thalassotalea sp. G20_0]MBO9492845.1 SET domain-containing protein-lysine N-methyltransferase [Thalassotalea sp. G20_0]
MLPSGIGFGQTPTNGPFYSREVQSDSTESTPAPAKKMRFDQVERNVAINNCTLPSVNSRPPSCNHCLGDMEAVFRYLMVLLRARSIELVPGGDYSGVTNQLLTLRNTVDEQIQRLNQGAGITVVNGQEVVYFPDSPVSERAMTPTSPGTDLPPPCIRSTEGVVHGTGVIANRNLKADQVICPYDGPLVFRILNQKKNGKYFVFTIKGSDNDDTAGVNILENDTYVAWSNVFIARSGVPGIELGRDCEHDIRFLNHSKQPNVLIRSAGVNSLAWGDRDTLQLTVVALRDIKKGEELVFDYDKNQADSEIDFSISTVDQVTKNQRNNIIQRVKSLNKKCLQGGKKRPAKTMEKEVDLPESLDIEIGKIMDKIKAIRGKSHHPVSLNQLKAGLNNKNKELLKIIFSNNPSILEDIASYLSSLKIELSNDMDKLTMKNIDDLKKYLAGTIFNGKQTWFDVAQLKEYLDSFKWNKLG